MAVSHTSRVAIFVGIAGLLAAAGAGLSLDAQQPAAGPSLTPAHVSLIDEYCLSCHDEDKKRAGLALDTIAARGVLEHPDVWEKVIRKLRARQMPPAGKDRPNEAAYDALIATLETSLDRAARN